MKQGMGNQMGLPWETGLKRDQEKTEELDFCGPWKYPRGLMEKGRGNLETHSFIYPDP